MANLKELDPVQGLVDYVLDIKPYHTKIVEVLVEYVHGDTVDVTIQDLLEFDIDLQWPPGQFVDINTDPLLPPNWVLQPGTILDPFAAMECLNNGSYDTTGYGGNPRLLISSPNPGISFQAYPAIDTGTNTVTINGNWTTEILVGDSFNINSYIEDYTNPLNIITTVGNHTGTYTVTAVEYNGGSVDYLTDPYDPFTIQPGNNQHTIITVAELLAALPTLTLPDEWGTNHSYIAEILLEPLLIESALPYVNVAEFPNNAFVLDVVEGDRTAQFMQGTRIDVFDSLSEGTYTVLHSDFVDSKTRIRVAENIFDIGLGNLIIGTSGGFQVPGIQPKYTTGVNFVVTGSPQNNGSYVVGAGGTTYNSASGVSTIDVVETLDGATGGELHLDITGAIKRHTFGYDETSPLCRAVPDTILSTAIFTDELNFAWGKEEVTWWQYNLIEARPETLVPSNLVVYVGDNPDTFARLLINMQVSDEIRILSTNVNNGLVQVTATPTYDPINKTATIPVTKLDENDIPVILNYRYNEIVEFPDDDIVKILGNAALMLQGGDMIDIVGGTVANIGTYEVVGASYVAPHSYIIITTTFPDPLATDGDVQFIERGGWIEPAYVDGIQLRFEDSISSTFTENADGALLLSAGSLVGAWDYPGFDVGSFDENLGTVIHLFSNTF